MHISWSFPSLLQTSTTAEQVNLSTISIDFLFSRNLLVNNDVHFHIHSAKKKKVKKIIVWLAVVPWALPLQFNSQCYPLHSTPPPLWLPFSLFYKSQAKILIRQSPSPYFMYRPFLIYSKRPPSTFFALLNYHLTHAYFMIFP